MKRALEIGPGSERLPGGWTTVDCVPRQGVVDTVCRWGTEPLPFPDNTFELVYAAHVLEHIPWYQTLDALREAMRILIPGGTLELHVPDFDVLVQASQSRCCLDDHTEDNLNDPLHWMHWVAERLFHLGEDHQWHKACFNSDHLTWCLQEVGFTEIAKTESERGLSHGVINLGMSATKPTATALSSPLGTLNSMDKNALIKPQDDQPGVGDGLPYCHSRREYDRPSKTFFCAHPNVHLPGNVVTSDICRICTRWQDPAPKKFRPFSAAARDGPCWHLGEQIGLRNCSSCRGNIQIKVFDCGHPSHESTTIKECLHCTDYESRLQRSKVSRWSVGITTAPRKMPTLKRMLDSLANAGWTSARLFAEPGSRVPDGLDELSVTCRESTFGAWSNWFLGLSELYQREPQADAYLMLQDDVVFCRSLRSYLETVLWPAETIGVVSLYNPTRCDSEQTFKCSRPGGLPGALALCFPNFSVRLLLGDPDVIAHRRGARNGTKLIDLVVGEWAERHGLASYLHFPSLTQHIGKTTTIWPSSEDNVTRQARGFVGEEFDARLLTRTIRQDSSLS